MSSPETTYELVRPFSTAALRNINAQLPLALQEAGFNHAAHFVPFDAADNIALASTAAIEALTLAGVTLEEIERTLHSPDNNRLECTLIAGAPSSLAHQDQEQTVRMANSVSAAGFSSNAEIGAYSLKIQPTRKKPLMPGRVLRLFQTHAPMISVRHTISDPIAVLWTEPHITQEENRQHSLGMQARLGHHVGTFLLEPVQLVPISTDDSKPV